MLRTSRLVLLLFAAVAFVPACADEGGSDDDATATTEASDDLTAEEQEYADAFAVTLTDDTNGLAVKADDADCMATAMMAELGVEPFEDADVTPDDIDPE